MKISIKTLCGLILALIVLVTLVWAYRPTNESHLPDETLIKTLQSQNDSINQLNKELTATNYQLQNQSDSILLLLQEDHKVIDQLNQKKNETIRVIDHYDHDELYEFFANYRLKTESSPDKN